MASVDAVPAASLDTTMPDIIFFVRATPPCVTYVI